MGDSFTTFYSFVIKGPASEDDVKNFVDLFDLLLIRLYSLV